MVHTLSKHVSGHSFVSTEDPQDFENGAAKDESVRGRITINDVARLANVSKKTVSRVINQSPSVRDETRKKVEAVIEEYGFKPDPQARALAFRRSLLICLAFDSPSPQYSIALQRGILDVLEGTDYQLVLHPVDRSNPEYQDRIRRFVEGHRPTGVIMTPSVSDNNAVPQMLSELGCKYVRIASVKLDDEERMVRTYDAKGAAQAARHLAELGHTRIAHIHGPRTYHSAHERLAGFREGLSEFGLELEDDLIIEAGYTYDSGVQAADKLLALSDRPTAIFAGNDEMAIGAFASARKAGLKIPENLSIVGFDDTSTAAQISPPLTTVRLPIREMGRKAAEALLQNVSESDNYLHEGFMPEIIVRDSTAKPE